MYDPSLCRRTPAGEGEFTGWALENGRNGRDRSSPTERTFDGVLPDMARHPDVFLLVLDCVSAEDFSLAAEEFRGLERVERFLRESAKFERAVAVAPWTLPSHASILTGLYPWELSPDPDKSFAISRSGVRTLPALLRDEGYRSCCLSANCLVSPRTHLTDDFDESAWGRWWDIYVRTGGLLPPNESTPESRGVANDSPSNSSSPLLPLLDVAPIFARVPAYGRLVSHLVQRVRNPSSPPTMSIAPWIEPSLRTWLGQQRKDTPVFVLMNLLDAHEPYYPAYSTARAPTATLRPEVPRQDRIGWLLGRWSPSSTELEALRHLYRAAIRGLGYRLEQFLAIVEEFNRSADSLIVLTSDHGQAFGAGRALFHSHGTEESLLRIPLFIRGAGFAPGTRHTQGWVSLIDLVPTVLRAVGAEVPPLPSAMAIQDIAKGGRSGPVFAYSTGLALPRANWVAPQVREVIDGLRAVGYHRNQKVTVGPNADRVETVDLGSEASWVEDSRGHRESDARGPLDEVLALYSRMSSTRPLAAETEVQRRLRSWGY
jgi:arylsulfatase A-like enzyme